jgi:hypothetical protein
MCNCPDWHVIYQNSPDALNPGGGGSGLPGSSGPQRTPTPGVFAPTGQTKSVGPIVGVRSSVHEEALAEWRGQKFYDEWRFIMGDADRDTMTGFGPTKLPPGAIPPKPIPR